MFATLGGERRSLPFATLVFKNPYLGIGPSGSLKTLFRRPGKRRGEIPQPLAASRYPELKAIAKKQAPVSSNPFTTTETGFRNPARRPATERAGGAAVRGYWPTAWPRFRVILTGYCPG